MARFRTGDVETMIRMRQRLGEAGYDTGPLNDHAIRSLADMLSANGVITPAELIDSAASTGQTITVNGQAFPIVPGSMVVNTPSNGSGPYTASLTVGNPHTSIGGVIPNAVFFDEDARLQETTLEVREKVLMEFVRSLGIPTEGLVEVTIKGDGTSGDMATINTVHIIEIAAKAEREKLAEQAEVKVNKVKKTLRRGDDVL